MGIKDKLKDKAKKKLKGAGLKTALTTVISALTANMLPIIAVAIVGVIVTGVIDMAIEVFTGDNNPKLVYESLEIEDIAELVTIKGDDENGYYLDFVDKIDDKLDKIIKQANKSGEYHSLPDDTDFLKRMIKAEIVTQFPNLGGKIPDGAEDGFQGAIDIKRVTPNKTLGELKNTGKGETSTVEQSAVDEPVDMTDRNDENRLKKLKEGQELKVVPIGTPLYENVKRNRIFFSNAGRG